jgi:hypothetical protein
VHLRDGLHAGQHLPLGDAVHGVDVDHHPCDDQPTPLTSCPTASTTDSQPSLRLNSRWNHEPGSRLIPRWTRLGLDRRAPFVLHSRAFRHLAERVSRFSNV